MRWHVVTDRTTGSKHNALAADVEGAKRDMANVAARGCPGRRGHVIEGDRYEVDGQMFDVAFSEEALQGAQPSRSERVSERERLARDFDRNINEGGDGFNPYRHLPSYGR